jgi:hypothetical protein
MDRAEHLADVHPVIVTRALQIDLICVPQLIRSDGPATAHIESLFARLPSKRRHGLGEATGVL